MRYSFNLVLCTNLGLCWDKAHDLKMEDKEASLARHTNGFKHETWKAPHRHLPIGLLPKQVDCTHRNVNRLALWLRDSFDAVY